MKERSVWPERGTARSVDYGNGESIFLIADDAGALARMRSAARAAGCRIIGSAGLAEAGERLERKLAIAAVAIHFADDGFADLLLGRLDRAAREGRFRSVVSSSQAVIDPIAAAISHPDVHQLCDPDGLDWTEALIAAAAPRRLWLNDVGKDRGAPRLQQLSEEVGRIANILASLSDEDDGAAAETGQDERNPSRRIDAGQIRAIIRARRMRDHFFKSDLFADPAWDMLLDLMAARLEQRKVAVSSLCIAAAVPPTTALRWIKTLSEQGLFVRVADAEDGRRVFIELSDRAAADLESYLKSAHRISPILI